MSTIEAPVGRRRAEPAPAAASSAAPAAHAPAAAARAASRTDRTGAVAPGTTAAVATATATMTSAATAPRSAWGTGRAWTWRTTLLALAVAYVTYTVAKLIGAGDVETARTHALWVVDLERHLGLDVEGPVQRALDASVPIWIFNHLYMAAQFLVVPAVLVLVRLRSVVAFRRLRDTLVVTWVLATPVNALFAVAPPRMAGIGITDTITASGSSALTSNLSMAFYNPLAAVPSLHVAFAFAVGIAAATTFRSWPVRALGLAWGPIIALTVVATGNHYVFDAVAGVAITLLGLAIAAAPRRSPLPAMWRGLSAAGSLALTPAPSVVSLRSVARPVAATVARRDDEAVADGDATRGGAAAEGTSSRASRSRGRGNPCSAGR